MANNQVKETAEENYYKCNICGKQTKKHCLMCDTCNIEFCFNTASKTKYSDYSGYIYDPKSCMFFMGKEEMENYYMGIYPVCEKVPAWAFACSPVKLELNIDYALETTYTDCGGRAENYPMGIVDFSELLNFVNYWNEKQGALSWRVKPGKVVLLGE